MKKWEIQFGYRYYLRKFVRSLVFPYEYGFCLFTILKCFINLRRHSRWRTSYGRFIFRAAFGTVQCARVNLESVHISPPLPAQTRVTVIGGGGGNNQLCVNSPSSICYGRRRAKRFGNGRVVRLARYSVQWCVPLRFLGP